MTERVSKIEAARRQIDAAIDMYFNSDDALACYTLAYAGLKVLMDIYPHHNNDGFEQQLDEIVGKVGWRHLSGIGNFLKHADRDPGDVLEHFHPDSAYTLLGLATLLYRRIAGDFSAKMKALDFWTETIGAEELGIQEIDQNNERAATAKQLVSEVKAAPRHIRMAAAKAHYEFFLNNIDRLVAEVEQAEQEGIPLQQLLDRSATE